MAGIKLSAKFIWEALQDLPDSQCEEIHRLLRSKYVTGGVEEMIFEVKEPKEEKKVVEEEKEAPLIEFGDSPKIKDADAGESGKGKENIWGEPGWTLI